MLSIAFSSDGKYVATACSDMTLRLWDIRTGSQKVCLSHQSAVNSVAFDATGRYLATATSDGSVLVWNMKIEHASKPEKQFAHEEAAYAVEFSSDGRNLASGGSDNTARVWDVEKGLEVAKMMHPQTVLDVAFCPSEQSRLATACGDGESRVWRWQTSDLINEACKRVSRNLTKSEWFRFVGPIPYERTITDTPE